MQTSHCLDGHAYLHCYYDDIPQSPGSVHDPMGTRNGVSDVTREAERADDGVSPGADGFRLWGRKGFRFTMMGPTTRRAIRCDLHSDVRGELFIIERRGTS